ncbi:MAG: hypothetical protein AAF899_13000 [Pseudomonadota bacterium]
MSHGLRALAIGSVMGVLVIGIIGAGASAGDATLDPRLAENPALRALHDRDPAAAASMLADIEALLAGPQAPRPRSLDTDEQVIETLMQNPILQEAYRRDPKATAKLIDVIRPSVEE